MRLRDSKEGEGHFPSEGSFEKVYMIGLSVAECPSSTGVVTAAPGGIQLLIY